MTITTKYLRKEEEPINWDGVYLARDTTSCTWRELCEQIEADARYSQESHTVTINEIDYDIESINILNFDDEVEFFKLIKI